MLSLALSLIDLLSRRDPHQFPAHCFHRSTQWCAGTVALAALRHKREEAQYHGGSGRAIALVTLEYPYRPRARRALVRRECVGLSCAPS
jgi:hypothetical protein